MTGKYPLIDKSETGRRIRRIMEEKNLSVKDLQSYLGFATSQAVYHWLGGRSLPSIDNLYALSQLFQMQMDDLICGNRCLNQGRDSGCRRLKAYMDKYREMKAA